MMRINRYITLSLCTILMLTLSLVPLSMASHSIDHHHHSAQSHTTGICAWMCTAAQTISSDSQIVSPEVSLLEILQPLPIVFEPAPQQPLFPARAPPILL